MQIAGQLIAKLPFRSDLSYDVEVGLPGVTKDSLSEGQVKVLHPAFFSFDRDSSVRAQLSVSRITATCPNSTTTRRTHTKTENETANRLQSTQRNMGTRKEQTVKQSETELRFPS